MFKRRRTVKKRRPTKASYRRKSVKRNRVRIYRKQRGGVEQCAICYEKDICNSCVFDCQTIKHKFCPECTTALIGIPGQTCPMCRSDIKRDAAREFLFPTRPPQPPIIIPPITCGRLLNAARDLSCPFLSIRTPLFLLTGLFSAATAIASGDSVTGRLIGIVGATASSLMAISRRSEEVAQSRAMLASVFGFDANQRNNQHGGGEDPDLYICCMYESDKDFKQLYFEPEDFKKGKKDMLIMFTEKDSTITDKTLITTVLYLNPVTLNPLTLNPLTLNPLKDPHYEALKKTVEELKKQLEELKNNSSKSL